MTANSKRKPNTVDAHVGSRIRLRRVLMDISQVKLAEELGVSFQQIQKYERGVNRVGASRLQEIADVLGAPITFFFDDMPGRPSSNGTAQFREAETEQMAEFLSSADGLRFVRTFLSISDGRVRRRITDLVKSLADQDVAGETDEDEQPAPVAMTVVK
ncbi:helix-turn-helix domain-containing protein [Roseibium salinum]|uniref:Helix-turn-helix domain-containing protein n=1 Tax=Roseibium salinum TaxID=1604349 RepID=A0ABT3QX13_9HYPH|nr:helix-turn-helix domain-containing protein [Roseibium sp. DSM 29163]MCX2721469.1 helix-turn-helix domain-containing protein [Roseibium sp. DSM 29163]